MARITVQDCAKVIKNRPELIVLAAERSRQIAAGSPLHLKRDNDKNPVVALREIAGELLSVEGLRDTVIKRYQKLLATDEPERGLGDSASSEGNALDEELSSYHLSPANDLEEGFELDEMGFDEEDAETDEA